MSAETIEVPTGEPAARAGRRPLKIAATGLVLVLAVAAGMWFLVFAPQAEASQDTPLAEGEIVQLEAFTTSLGTAQLHHARVALAVVLAQGVDPAVVPAREALLRDALLQELATMDADAIRSAQGSNTLRERLSASAREIWEEDEVVRVVLTELLVQ